MQLFLFANAATYDVKNIPLAVFNEDHGRLGRDLVARFVNAPSFARIIPITADREIAPLVDRQKAAIVLHIGQDFSRRIMAGQDAVVQVIVDGRRSNVALIMLGYARNIVFEFAADMAAERGYARPAARLDMRAWYNPNMESKWFIVPALVVLLVMLIATVMTALSVARERELGTLAQLLVTPLSPLEIIIGKIIPAGVLGLAEGSLIIAFALFWFKIPLVGDIAWLYVALCVFLLSVVGFGLMILSMAATQQQAVFGAFLFFIPAVILSGFATPIASMAPAVRLLSYLDPMRYAISISRGVFLQGMPPAQIFANLWPMALIGIVALAVALPLFRRRLE